MTDLGLVFVADIIICEGKQREDEGKYDFSRANIYFVPFFGHSVIFHASVIIELLVFSALMKQILLLYHIGLG